MSGSIANAAAPVVHNVAQRSAAHELLEELLDALTVEGYFGVGTLELGSQNGKICKCEADARRRLRPRTRLCQHSDSEGKCMS